MNPDGLGAEPGEGANRCPHAFWPELGVFWVDDAQLVDWYLATNANLIEALDSASPDVEAWTFLPAPSPLAMWARRQAHETAIHRYDAESAADDRQGFESVFASDGIDEILCGMTTQRRLDVPIPEPQAMLVHATDTDRHWLTTFESDVVTTVAADGRADVTVAGGASDIYLALWNRIDDSNVGVSGDRKVLDTWHRTFRVRWYQNG